MRIKSQQDFFAGLLFCILGAAFAIGSTTYRIGSAARMGPGYFPLVLGAVLTVLGAFIVFGSLVVETEDGEKMGPWAWRPLLLVVGANVAFGVLLVGLPSIALPAMGMVVAIYALVLIASLASRDFAWKGALVLATVLSAASYVAFIGLLKLQVQVWPTFIGR